MNGERVKMDLGSLGQVEGALTFEVIAEMEQTLGTVGYLAGRFATKQQGIGDCAAIIFLMAKHADADAAPTREEIVRAVFEVGMIDVTGYIDALLHRAMNGERSTSDESEEGAEGGRA